MDGHGDVGVHPRLGDGLEGLAVQQHEVAELGGAVQHDHHHHAVILLGSARPWDEHGLAGVVVLLVPDLGKDIILPSFNFNHLILNLVISSAQVLLDQVLPVILDESLAIGVAVGVAVVVRVDLREVKLVVVRLSPREGILPVRGEHMPVLHVNLVSSDLKEVLVGPSVRSIQHGVLVSEVFEGIPGYEMKIT